MTRPLALTLGEPAGIGPDITFAAWQVRAELALPPFYLLAHPDFVGRRARELGLNIPVRVVEPEGAAETFAAALPVVALPERVTAEPAHPDASSAPAAIASIRRAVADVFAGRAHAVVTNPVAKAVLYRTGFAEPGHTEYLAKLSQEHTGRAAHPVMMLWSPELAVVPVTIHLPVRDVPRHLTAALIVDTGRIVARDLRERSGIARPRLAACRGARVAGRARVARAKAPPTAPPPPRRDVIRRHDLPAPKSLGQNFLLDLNLTGRIARAAGPLDGVTVLEIGPGPGGLTRALLAEGADVIAVERDERAIAALREIVEHYPDRLRVIQADALTFDLAPRLNAGAVRIVANL